MAADDGAFVFVKLSLVPDSAGCPDSAFSEKFRNI
jgi:hypothetical protein